MIIMTMIMITNNGIDNNNNNNNNNDDDDNSNLHTGCNVLNKLKQMSWTQAN